MKFVSIKSSATEKDVVDALGNSEKVNERVQFDERRGRPLMKLKRKKNTLYISCEMIGGPAKDNGFIIGSFFLGKIKERENGTKIAGILMTAPIYHLVLLGFCVYFAIRSFEVGGIAPLPFIIAGTSLLFFKDEFKKQGIIKRYVHRAVRYAEKAGSQANAEAAAADKAENGSDVIFESSESQSASINETENASHLKGEDGSDNY